MAQAFLLLFPSRTPLTCIVGKDKDTVTHGQWRQRPAARMCIQRLSVSHLPIMLLAIHPSSAAPRPCARLQDKAVRRVHKSSIEKTCTVNFGQLEGARALEMQRGMLGEGAFWGKLGRLLEGGMGLGNV